MAGEIIAEHSNGYYLMGITGNSQSTKTNYMASTGDYPPIESDNTRFLSMTLATTGLMVAVGLIKTLSRPGA